MALTVGELVAFVDLDDKGLKRGVSSTERELNKLESTATRSTARMETAVVKGFDRMHAAAGKSGKSIVSSLESALASVEKIAGDAGGKAGDAFAKGADDRLKSSKSRFTMGSLFDGIADTAVSVGGKVGDAFNKGFDVLGKAGPANVAIAGAAIAGLPAIAGVAAGGIVLALGGALATVGITAAAQSDVVRDRWKQLGSDLKRELADAAQPLEGSLLRAADVAEDVFTKLKPTLSNTFKDLVPDIDRFVDTWGDGIASLGPGVDALGDGFGDILNSLSDRSPEIFENFNSALTTLGRTASEHSDDLASLVVGISKAVDAGADLIDVLADVWDGVTEMQGAGDALDINPFVGPLNALKFNADEVDIALDKVRDAVVGVGGATGEASVGVRNLSDALETFFDPAAKALDAEIRLKDAIKDATQAAKDDKLTTIDRLKAVQDTTTAIADAATAEMERTGKTNEASKAFADQLPTLVDLAGKNDAARDAVAGLGNSLGVTIKRTDDGSIAVDKFGKAVITLPNGKEVKIDAATAKAMAALKSTQDKLDALKDKTVTVTVRTEQQEHGARASWQKNAKGAIERYAAGGVRAFAAGGRSMAPHIATSPTILYGEGAGDEAFIPYESRYRKRAIDLLSQVADDFGLQVLSKQGAQHLSDVGATIDTTGSMVGKVLTDASNSVMETLGGTGTLTNAIDGVGAVGGQVAASWTAGANGVSAAVAAGTGGISAAVGDMSNIVGISTDQIVFSVGELTDATVSVGDMISSAISNMMSAAKAATKTSSTNSSTYGRGGSQGAIIGPGPKSKSSKGGGGSEGAIIGYVPPLPGSNPDDMIGGHYGTGGMLGGGNGGMTTYRGGTPAGGVIVQIENATVREEADFGKLGAVFGFEYTARA